MIHVFIENEAGSNQKNNYNEKTLEYLSTVTVSRAYPYPYGFVLNTTGGDGDNVDCFVITTATLKSGETVACQPVGLITMTEDGDVDHKVLGILPGENVVIDQQVFHYIETFALNFYAHKPEKTIVMGELLDKTAAERYIQACLD